jgi:rhomboid family GlyGly-CTERM serine protease
MTVTARLSAGRDALARVNAVGPRGYLLGVLLAAILLPQLLGGAALSHSLRYDRAAMAAGEVLLSVTGQFVHLDLLHAVANAAGAIMIWALVGAALSVRGWLVVALASVAAVAAGLWWFSPTIEWYVGASGMLHGLLVAGAILHARSADPLAKWVLAIVTAKLLWEQIMGPLPFAGDSVVVVDAHLYGALGGTLAALGALLQQSLRSRRTPL